MLQLPPAALPLGGAYARQTKPNIWGEARAAHPSRGEAEGSRPNRRSFLATCLICLGTAGRIIYQIFYKLIYKNKKNKQMLLAATPPLCCLVALATGSKLLATLQNWGAAAGVVLGPQRTCSARPHLL